MDLLEFKIDDFTGGITDNEEEGTKQYLIGDNLLISENADIYSRPGSYVFGDMPATGYSPSDRINALINYNQSEKLILGQQNRLFYLSQSKINIILTSGSPNVQVSALPSFFNAYSLSLDTPIEGTGIPSGTTISSITSSGAFVLSKNAAQSGAIVADIGFPSVNYSRVEFLGPTGNPAFSAGTGDARVTWGTYKEQLILANTEYAYPIRIYKDQTNELRLITLGLPAFTFPNAYAGTAIPPQVIALASQMRTKFLAHYADTVAHPTSADTTATSIAPAADITNSAKLSDLITFVTQLILAYTHHFNDATLAQNARLVHDNTYLNPGQPNVSITSPFPTDLLSCAVALNELKLKYHYHIRSLKGHPYGGGLPGASYYITLADLVGTTSGPTIAPADVSNLITTANALKAVINAHIVNSLSHAVSASSVVEYKMAFGGVLDTADEIVIPDCTDLPSLVELTAHMYTSLLEHHQDAMQLVYDFTAENNSGSNLVYSIAQVSPANGDVTNLTHGMYILVDDSGSPIGTTHNYFPYGTYINVGNPDPVSGQFFTSFNANNVSIGGHAADTIRFWVSKKRYHIANKAGAGNAVVYDPTPANGLVNTITDFNALINRPINIAAALKDYITKLTYHTSSDFFHYLSVNQFYALGYASLLSNLVSYTENSFLYAFTYTYTYTDSQGTQFLEESKPYFAGDSANPYILSSLNSYISNQIAGLPTLVNVGGQNYDISNIMINIYRTTGQTVPGTVLYQIGQIANGVTTFTDNYSDAEIISLPQLYTTGGVVDNDPPPLCRFIHVVNSQTAYFGDVIDTADRIPNRVRQGLPNNLGSAPAASYVDLKDPVSGISSVRNIPVAFTENGTYRLEGGFDATGQGSLTAIAVSDSIGNIANISPVQIDGGILFAGNDGFYFTDAYRVQKITTHLQKTYTRLTQLAEQRDNITGVYDKEKHLVYFSVKNRGDSPDNDTLLVLNLHFGITPESTFTTWSNGVDFAPTSLAIFKGDLVRGDRRGYLFRHNETYLSDPKVSYSNTATWTNTPVIWDYLSNGIDFGTGMLRKWVTMLTTRGTNYGNVSIQPISRNDYNNTETDLAAIRYRDNLVWGDPTVVWGDSSVIFGGGKTGSVNQRRRYPANTLRCSTKQVHLTNAFCVLVNSDFYDPAGVLGQATVTGATVTLGTIAGVQLVWPEDLTGLYLTFSLDNYTAQYQITDATQRASGILTIASAPGNGVYKWEIVGIPLNEAFDLKSYSLHYAPIGKTQQTAAGQTGAPA